MSEEFSRKENMRSEQPRGRMVAKSDVPRGGTAATYLIRAGHVPDMLRSTSHQSRHVYGPHRRAAVWTRRTWFRASGASRHAIVPCHGATSCHVTDDGRGPEHYSASIAGSPQRYLWRGSIALVFAMHPFHAVVANLCSARGWAAGVMHRGDARGWAAGSRGGGGGGDSGSNGGGSGGSGSSGSGGGGGGSGSGSGSSGGAVEEEPWGRARLRACVVSLWMLEQLGQSVRSSQNTATDTTLKQRARHTTRQSIAREQRGRDKCAIWEI